MLFNSLEFFVFIILIFFLYWFVFNKSLKLQNLFLVFISYIFYGWWDWRFLFLIFFSSLTDYYVGLKLEETKKEQRKYFLYLSLFINLGLLGFFKYYNFFIESLVDCFKLLGIQFNFQTLNIILPVGISFYTFQTMSYTIDIYRKKIFATRDIVSFFAFVSFFPQLVAGPIEKAKNLLPQFFSKRIFNYDQAVSGMKLILWGLFKKIVIADNCAKVADLAFNNYENYLHSSSTLLLGVVYFSIQIYCDFSGYSDIALGIAKLFGFNLSINFKTPYFSRSIVEFWQRWHISLTSWFRDYVYIPLGGNRVNIYKKIRNVFLIFLLSGFWHGANWKFIFWGLLNALYFLPSIIFFKQRNINNIKINNKIFSFLKERLKILTTFLLITFSWIFFRAENLTIGFHYFVSIFSKSFFSIPMIGKSFFIFLLLFMTIEWIQRESQYTLEKISNSILVNWLVYMLIVLSIILLAPSDINQNFIYFQF